MIAPLLDKIKADDFAVAVGFLLPAPALRRVLKHRPEVQEIEDALGAGTLTEENIRTFVSGCMSELRRGERFPHDLAMAALAAVVEYRPTEFAEEYLRDLSRLKLAEMSTSIRMARECLVHRRHLPATYVSYSAPATSPDPESRFVPGNGFHTPASNVLFPPQVMSEMG